MIEDKLFQACKTGNVESVIEVLKDENIDLNKSNNHEWTALQLACANGHLDIVKLLLEDERVGINKGDNCASTPLHFACLNGHLDIVKLLLADERLDANKVNSRGYNPFYVACYLGWDDIIKFLMQDNRVEISKLPSTLLDDHKVLSNINAQMLYKKDLLDMLHFFSANGKLNAVKWIVKTLKIPSISDEQLIKINPIIKETIQEYKDSFLEVQIVGAVDPSD
jgi:ankyrin repeat protein